MSHAHALGALQLLSFSLEGRSQHDLGLLKLFQVS
jgi:hypothetical protein